MKSILLLHGPNLNLLSKRNPNYYGHLTLSEIEKLTQAELLKFNYSIICYQSNHEGDLIDTLQARSTESAGIIINPGALSHYSYALHDALVDTALPIVEVHLSKIEDREKWRQHSVTADAAIKAITGKKERGYIEAVLFLMEYLKHDRS